MKKHLYEIKRLDIPAYLKWWFIKYRNAGTLSEVLENLTSPITLTNSLKRRFKIFEIGGNSVQDGTPSPENEVPIKNVTGNVEVKVANGTDSTVTGYEEQTATFPLEEGMEMCKIGDYADKFVKQEGKWYKKKIINKELIKPVNGAIEANGIRLGVSLTKPVIAYPTLLCKFFQTGRNYAECVNSNRIYPNRLGLNGSGVVLCNASGYTTVEEYLNLFTNNDIYVYYPLLEPIYEEITDQALITQLDKLDKLISYKGTTHISSSNNPSPLFTIQYVKEET